MNHHASKSGLVRLSVFGLLFAFVLVPSASADTIYTYTGNAFDEYPSGEWGIMFSMRVAQPLGPNLDSVSITPEYIRFSGYPSPLISPFLRTSERCSFEGTQCEFEFSTGPTGVITQWNVFYRDSQDLFLWTYSLTGYTLVDDYHSFDLYCDRQNSNNPGSWSITTNVPEPSTLLVFSTGLLTLLGAARRKRLK